ncbi:MAG TPA: nuclear transport factor 2 family protein [Pyrinomonadaceae bacterium]|jgi:ketosteroid isomerase-like protein
MMMKIIFTAILLFAIASLASAQTTTKTTTTKTATAKTVTTATSTTAQTPDAKAVRAAFDRIVDGIRKSDVEMVTGVYQNSANTIYFNNNGTVTRGWEQDKQNRESRYPDVTNVKLDVRDVRVEMLGTNGAYVSCLWTQTQEYKGTPESASGRMTVVFRKVGNAWKAVHLHTSPDRPDAARPVFPSERTPIPN